MTTELDHGTRCDKHIGEAFPPRCATCDQAQLEAATETLHRGECNKHDGYPLPCERCAREAIN
jgi:hypothetical protein